MEDIHNGLERSRQCIEMQWSAKSIENWQGISKIRERPIMSCVGHTSHRLNQTNEDSGRQHRWILQVAHKLEVHWNN